MAQGSGAGAGSPATAMRWRGLTATPGAACVALRGGLHARAGREPAPTCLSRLAGAGRVRNADAQLLRALRKAEASEPQPLCPRDG